MSFGNEVSTGHFIYRMHRGGQNSGAPRVDKTDGKGCRLSLYIAEDPVKDMVPALGDTGARSFKSTIAGSP